MFVRWSGSPTFNFYCYIHCAITMKFHVCYILNKHILVKLNTHFKRCVRVRVCVCVRVPAFLYICVWGGWGVCVCLSVG